MTEELVSNENERNLLTESIEQLHAEFILYPLKEKNISNSKQTHSFNNDREKRKILKEQLKKLKRGLSI